jgi:serine/threonine protein kinase
MRDARTLLESDDDDDDADIEYALRTIHNGRLGTAYNDNCSIYLSARQEEVKELVSTVPPKDEAKRVLDRDARSLYGVMTSEVGTPFFVAPEVLLEDEYTCLCDIWSIGVIAYLLLSKGHFPTNTYDERECIQTLMDANFQVQFPPELWQGVSQDAQDFCAYLLQIDPRKRPTAKQSIDHPWIRERMASASARTLVDKDNSNNG